MSYSHKEPVRKIIYSIFLSREKRSLFWLFDFVTVGRSTLTCLVGLTMLLNHPQVNRLVTESTEISPFPAGYSFLVIYKNVVFFAFYAILLYKLYDMNLLCHGRKTHDLQSIMHMSSLCHSAPTIFSHHNIYCRSCF